MGYAIYDTPMGEAGYAVVDTCHKNECTAEIDRGLSFLCGGTPGRADEYGCGRWFCSAHLFIPPVALPGVDGLCPGCLAELGDEDDDDDPDDDDPDDDDPDDEDADPDLPSGYNEII